MVGAVRPRFVTLAMAMAVPVALVSLPAVAQVARQSSGGGQASAQLMQQYQQASAARDSLQAENAQLKQHAEQLQQQLDAATKAQAAAERKFNGLQQQTNREGQSQQAVEGANQKLNAQLAAVVGRYKEMTQQLKDVETDRASLRIKSADDARKLSTCIDHNAQMYLLSEEILGRYEHRGFWTRAADVEPFTRLSRTRLENLADDYRERISELRIKPTAATAPGGAASAAGHAAPKP
jgi:chromosome segregation ATPase